MELDKSKVLVGMSGGVDSSVAAVLLQKEGYDVSALTVTPFKIDSKCKSDEAERSCCNQKSLLDALDISKQLNMKHHLIDLTDEFKNQVVENFVSEYLSGRTPNPCVLCNPQIKWKALIEKANQENIYYVATGHYANIRYDDKLKRNVLYKGLDKNKDQSYFLWRLSADILSRTIFPLGNLEKGITRQIADENKLKIHKKPDSQEICFVPDNDYRLFLEDYLKTNEFKKGDFVLNGKKIGVHNGIAFYTVGQRKGLGVSYKVPLYVNKIDAANNIIELAEIENTYCSALIADDIILSKYDELAPDKEFTVKIRYRDAGSIAKCEIKNNSLIVSFNEQKKAIAPGQSVVIYEGDDLVGGAVIKDVY